MAFNMLAADFENGWAFVECDEEILLVRPPYDQRNISVVTESTLEKALSTPGFVMIEGRKSFEDRESLIDYLRQKLVEARKDQGSSLPDSESVRSLVRYAPVRILKDYLNRIESQLIPNREWDAALDLLTTLLGLEKVQKDSHLLLFAVDLLRQCQQEMAEAKSVKQQLIGEPELVTDYIQQGIRITQIDSPEDRFAEAQRAAQKHRDLFPTDLSRVNWKRIAESAWVRLDDRMLRIFAGDWLFYANYWDIVSEDRCLNMLRYAEVAIGYIQEDIELGRVARHLIENSREDVDENY